jgi:hypothetical protein
VIKSESNVWDHAAGAGKISQVDEKRISKKIFGQCWQIETVFSMLKRNIGSALRAQSYYSQIHEIHRAFLPTT